MTKFGNLYSQYYDLLYSDKDYESEVDFVNTILSESSINAKTLLDLGCGTGFHAEIFCDKGYMVHGIDLSEDMLEIAEMRRKGKEENLTFSHSNIQDLNLNKEFDAVVSLFHVISYQKSNEELIKAFYVAKDHVKSGGIFIFDFWYGPAVLNDLPVTRVKRLADEKMKVTRIAEPLVHPLTNTVDVNYDVFLENLDTNEIIEKKELHQMRYLFDTELELICEQVGFDIQQKYEWMSGKKPDLNSWNVVWVLKK
jgi:SAM-dependent methyltransferase